MSHQQTAPTIPSTSDALMAAAARATLQKNNCPGQPLRVQIGTGDHSAVEIELPGVVTALLMDILKQTAAGNAVTLVPVHAELTTQQAADLLRVSRPYLISLVENGTLPVRLVGKHRRLLLRDVLAYKADAFEKAEAALDEMAAINQELGLYD